MGLLNDLSTKYKTISIVGMAKNAGKDHGAQLPDRGSDRRGDDPWHHIYRQRRRNPGPGDRDRKAESICGPGYACGRAFSSCMIWQTPVLRS